MIGTNLDGVYNVLRPIVMPMVSARRGDRIVTLSSVSGIAGNRGPVNYSAAKAGIIGATKMDGVAAPRRMGTRLLTNPTRMTLLQPASIPTASDKRVAVHGPRELG